VNDEDVARLLREVAQGLVEVEEALEILKQGPLHVDDEGTATLDLHRRLRLGLGEVVFGEGKTTQQILEILDRLAQHGGPVLVTRLDDGKLRAIEAALPAARINPVARTALVHPPIPKDASSGEPFVAIVSAGTSDQPVVEEARETCLAMDVPVESMVDVGVAGLHRLIRHLPVLRRAAAVVVVAGMDGVLPSVVGGLVPGPVFGGPTSIGYGANLGGLGALLTMLNSCAPGVMVTNIDAGFSAAVAACNVARAVARAADQRSAPREDLEASS